MPNIGPLELIIVLVIALLVFGPKRLPTLGRQLGGGMREFKESITGNSSSRDDDEDATRAELPPPATGSVAAPPAAPAEPRADDEPVSRPGS